VAVQITGHPAASTKLRAGKEYARAARTPVPPFAARFAVRFAERPAVGIGAPSHLNVRIPT